MSNVTLGGDRLGSGNKQQVHLKNYERSTHDLSYIWRSSMASGTLVPFMSEVGLPGDNFEIDLEADIKTHPTIGPLFGSYKVQLDVFLCPIRLYNGKLHMNLLNIGLNMSQIKLPQLEVKGRNWKAKDQINPSSLLSYLNIRGIGYNNTKPESTELKRYFNAISFLSYWDIYKNYYANKQEEYGAYIHNSREINVNEINDFYIYSADGHGGTLPQSIDAYQCTAKIEFLYPYEPAKETVSIFIVNNYYPDGIQVPITSFWKSVKWDNLSQTLECSLPNGTFGEIGLTEFQSYSYSGATIDYTSHPKVELFDLANIDSMRESILQNVFSTSPYLITDETFAPYGTILQSGELGFSLESTQEGLALKTYQSDLFNNWISTEWIDGENGINQITAVDTSSGEFTINTLQLSNKVYDMLNRIAVSGGSYDDWLNAVYTHERTKSQENPMYMGGLIKELAFQEVVSNAATDVQNTAQALGTLAGKGVLTNKHKGGKVHIKVDEPSYIISLVSITPKIDYSQGNKYDVNLKTLDDLHKPALDEIGFQDLITDQMAYWDTLVDENGNVTYSSAGKQPAWINYMTNVNQTRGNFAVENEEMFMTLNRRYEKDSTGKIKDLTTYIDPAKFNNIFADTRLDAQNFWTQIAVNIKARRKMSARLMPNL